MLDAMGTVGSELAPATTSTAGWTNNGLASITSDGTTLTVQNTGAAEGQASFGAAIANATYQVTINVTNIFGSGRVTIGGTTTSLGGSTGLKSFFVVAASTAGVVVASNNATGSGVIGFNTFSVKQVTGIHATQPTTANKPTLRLSSGKYHWQLDGGDSFLTGNIGFTNAMTIVIAGRIDSLASINFLTSEDTGGCEVYVKTDGAVVIEKAIIAFLATSPASSIAAGTSFVITARLSAGTASIRKNGAQIVSAGTASVFSATTGMRIGARFAGTLNVNGVLSCVIPMPYALTDAECLLVERFAASTLPNAPSF